MLRSTLLPCNHLIGLSLSWFVCSFIITYHLLIACTTQQWLVQVQVMSIFSHTCMLFADHFSNLLLHIHIWCISCKIREADYNHCGYIWINLAMFMLTSKNYAHWSRINCTLHNLWFSTSAYTCGWLSDWYFLLNDWHSSDYHLAAATSNTSISSCCTPVFTYVLQCAKWPPLLVMALNSVQVWTVLSATVHRPQREDVEISVVA